MDHLAVVWYAAGAALDIVFGVALWITYKFVRGVIIGLGLGGTGLPTTIGVLATLALYTASVRLRLLSSIFGK